MKKHIPASIALCLALWLPNIAFSQETATPSDNDAEISTESLKTAYEQEQWDTAANIASKLLESSPENVDYLAIQGISYAHLEKFSEAESIFKKLQTLKPDDPKIMSSLCYTQFKLGRNEAPDNCKKSAKLNPEIAAAQLIAGQALENANRIDEANEIYAAAFKLNPDDLQTIALLSNTYYLQKNYKKFAETNVDALNRGIDYPILYLNAISALNLIGDYEKAIEWADKGYAKYKDTVMQQGKGEALYRLNRIEEAVKLLREVNGKTPDASVIKPRSNYYLARAILAEPCNAGDAGTCDTSESACCVKAQEAISLLEAIQSKSQLNDDDYDIYAGLAYMISGDLEKAEATLSKAIHKDMNQDNASALAALAVTLHQFSDPRDKAAAMQYYQQALDASPDFSDIQKVQQTRHWPQIALDILGQLKAEREKPAVKKSGCGCEIATSHAPDSTPLAALLSILCMLGMMLRLRRNR